MLAELVFVIAKTVLGKKDENSTEPWILMRRPSRLPINYVLMDREIFRS